MAEQLLKVTCDGCGQEAAPQHIARRLQRLEWTTRFRPVHINTFFLSDAAPLPAPEFLYGTDGAFQGEAAVLLNALDMKTEGKSREAVLSEFQKRGFFLSHVLECPVENTPQEKEALSRLLEARFRPVITRIRLSLRPKRVVLLSASLTPLAGALREHGLAEFLLLDRGKPFELAGQTGAAAAERLRAAL